MKKILALVLALVFTLTAVSALAGSSPEKPKNKTNWTEGDKETPVPDAKDTDGTSNIKEEVKKAEEDGSGLISVDPDAPANAKVTEMITVKFPSGVKNLTFKKKFQTPFTPGETVIILIGIPGDPVEWIQVKGIANEKGEVVFTIDQATYDKIVGKEVIMIVVKEG